MKPRSLGIAWIALLACPVVLSAQSGTPDPADVESPSAIVRAVYDAVSRAPGEPFEWDRFVSLFHPEARLVPNVEQTGGEFRVLSPHGFVEWIDGIQERTAPVGSAADRGFREEEIHAIVERYGDVAHVFSTYAKRFGDSDRVVGRGVNTFQLVRTDDRWWIVGIAWDEEIGAGPLPESYLP